MKSICKRDNRGSEGTPAQTCVSKVTLLASPERVNVGADLIDAGRRKITSAFLPCTYAGDGGVIFTVQGVGCKILCEV